MLAHAPWHCQVHKPWHCFVTQVYNLLKQVFTQRVQFTVDTNACQISQKLRYWIVPWPIFWSEQSCNLQYWKITRYKYYCSWFCRAHNQIIHCESTGILNGTLKTGKTPFVPMVMRNSCIFKCWSVLSNLIEQLTYLWTNHKIEFSLDRCQSSISEWIWLDL